MASAASYETGIPKTYPTDAGDHLARTSQVPFPCRFPADAVHSFGDLIKWTKKSEQSFELEFDLDDAMFLYRLEVEHNPERRLARVKREELTCNDLPLFEFANGEVQLYRDDHIEGPKYSFNWTQSGIASVAERHDNRRLSAFRDRASRFVTLFLEPRALRAVRKRTRTD